MRYQKLWLLVLFLIVSSGLSFMITQSTEDRVVITQLDDPGSAYLVIETFENYLVVAGNYKFKVYDMSEATQPVMIGTYDGLVRIDHIRIHQINNRIILTVHQHYNPDMVSLFEISADGVDRLGRYFFDFDIWRFYSFHTYFVSSRWEENTTTIAHTMTIFDMNNLDNYTHINNAIAKNTPQAEFYKNTEFSNGLVIDTTLYQLGSVGTNLMLRTIDLGYNITGTLDSITDEVVSLPSDINTNRELSLSHLYKFDGDLYFDMGGMDIYRLQQSDGFTAQSTLFSGEYIYDFSLTSDGMAIYSGDNLKLLDSKAGDLQALYPELNDKPNFYTVEHLQVGKADYFVLSSYGNLEIIDFTRYLDMPRQSMIVVSRWILILDGIFATLLLSHSIYKAEQTTKAKIQKQVNE